MVKVYFTFKTGIYLMILEVLKGNHFSFSFISFLLQLEYTKNKSNVLKNKLILQTHAFPHSTFCIPL